MGFMSSGGTDADGQNTGADQVMRPAARLSVVPDGGIDIDATILANVVVETLQRPMEELWELVITEPGADRWLGPAAAPAPGVSFASPIAPQFAGKIRSVRADDTSKTMFLDLPNRVVRFALLAASPETTTVVVEDPNIGFQPATREAWTRVVGEIADFHQAAAAHRPRMAVVVVHGIGEQRPGKTIEGFIKPVLGKGAEAVTSHPFHQDDGSEMRRYRAAEDVVDGKRRAETDFYEYYWAHHAGGTTLGQVLTWIVGLLLRNPLRMQRGTRSVWLSGWLGIILFASIIPAYMWIPALGRTLLIISLVGLAIFGIVIGGFLRNFLGDAARYLGSAPSNVNLRQTIRAEGVDLLRKLHQSGAYDRVILVGHSLGTVVGYDMIRHYWAEVNDTHRAPDIPSQDAIDEYMTVAQAIAGQGVTGDSGRELADHQDSQRQLWSEQRRNGNEWLVTDFVTLGSPLAHAQLLLSDGQEDFTERKRRLELPTCPPTLDVSIDADGMRTATIFEQTQYRARGVATSIKLLNQSSPFAPTRWSNLFYQGRFAGDPVGGPLRDAFGSGIVDIAVNPGKNPKFWGILGHPKYARGPALSELLASLDLFDYESLEELAAAMPVGYRLRSQVTGDRFD